MGKRIGLVRRPEAEIGAFITDAAHFADYFEGDLVVFDHPFKILADAPFHVPHELGEVPGTAVLEDPGTTGGKVYWTQADRDKWNANTFTVRSSDPNNRNIAIRVRKRIGG